MTINKIIKKHEKEYELAESVVTCYVCHSFKRWYGWTIPDEKIYTAVSNARYDTGQRVFKVSHVYCPKCVVEERKKIKYRYDEQ